MTFRLDGVGGTLKPLVTWRARSDEPQAVQQVLRPEPVGLAAMPEIHRLPRPRELRYEVKFVVEPTDLADVRAWLVHHPAGFATCYPDRVINNVYFDTPTMDAYEENLAGISARDKLRFRWYGLTWQPHKGTLEIKSRRTGTGWKWSSSVRASFDLEHQTWSQFRDLLRGHLPPAYRMMLDDHGSVTLVNRYHRAYFLSRDSKLRLTIDRDISYYPQIGRSRPGLWCRARALPAVVVEVKCATQDRLVAAEALRDIPWRASRHSKYAAGIEAMENL